MMKMINKKNMIALLLVILMAAGTAFAKDGAIDSAPAAAAPAAAGITMDDAKGIALADAGLTEDGVIMTLLGVDVEKKQTTYEVEFVAGGTEYEYDIDAANGDIVEKSTERAEGRKGKIQQGQYLSLDEARTKAVAAVNLTVEQVEFTETELDFDDGRAEYDVKFTADTMRYEIELNAENGEILRQESRTTHKAK